MVKQSLTPRQQAIRELERILRELRNEDNDAEILNEPDKDHLSIDLHTVDGDYEETQIRIQNIA